jgi:hypothetical protein
VASAVESFPMSLSSLSEIARVGPGRTMITQSVKILGDTNWENILEPGESASQALSSSFRGVPL